MCTRKETLAVIESAFEGVTLANGVGVYEANAIDDYAAGLDKTKAREKDVCDNWKLIPEDVIDAHPWSLSFMDEAGLRFALPAYICFSIYNFDRVPSASIDSLIQMLSTGRDWGFLSLEQKCAIAKLVCFLVLEGGGVLDVEQLSLAYEHFWSNYDY